MKFALLGAAGYVAPKHLAAIRAVGGDLVACMDPHDSVGVLDSYFPHAAFFTEFERFDRHIRKHPVDWVSIASPNYLHEPQTVWALDRGAKVICEKPLCLNPDNLDGIYQVEEYMPVFCVLQLRHHPQVIALRERLKDREAPVTATIEYWTPRGEWYWHSWKADEAKSGGLLMNIGIHYFDLLIHLLGPVVSHTVTQKRPDLWAGHMSHEKGGSRWELSVRKGEPKRNLVIDGETIDLSAALSDLHVEVYRAAMRGEGTTPEECRPSLELVQAIRDA